MERKAYVLCEWWQVWILQVLRLVFLEEFLVCIRVFVIVTDKDSHDVMDADMQNHVDICLLCVVRVRCLLLGRDIDSRILLLGEQHNGWQGLAQQIVDMCDIE
ncbi:MAG: hypothetical protein AAF193_10890 [Bacteroidota bacterium]